MVVLNSPQTIPTLWQAVSARVAVIRRILKGRIDAQMDAVIAGFIGCQGSDLAPPPLLVLFHVLHLSLSVCSGHRACWT